MNCCEGSKPKYNCGQRVAATCVKYEGYLPEYSGLKDSDCVTIEETTEELYKNQEQILKHFDYKSLGKKCLEYPVTEYNKKDIFLTKDILKVFEDEICRLKSSTVTSGKNDIEGYDLKCLTNDPCYKFNSHKDVINLLIDKVCKLEKRIEELENGV